MAFFGYFDFDFGRRAKEEEVEQLTLQLLVRYSYNILPWPRFHSPPLEQGVACSTKSQLPLLYLTSKSPKFDL